MRIYLCRHAQAAAGDPDELRELTPEGLEQARALGARLAALPTPPRLVLTSPLVRARQTAAEVADASEAPLRVEEALAPGATAETLLEALAGEVGPVATIGHQPDCSEIARALIGRDPGFPVAGMAEPAERVTAPALAVRELRKSYGAVEAVAGISFTVEQGEVFGLLGPNGAGKTTTVEILEGYRDRDGGEVTVLGVDPGRGGRALRERIGVVLQASELPPALSVREVHAMFAGYFARPRDIDEVIHLVGLEEKSGARVKTLSGGQKRRLDLGVALVGDPELLFLDEPTTGFDPAARRTAWELVRSFRALGKTILLTTHYLDEAQQLADRVAVIRDGRIVQQGSPAELIGVAPKVEIRYRHEGRDIVIETDEPTRVLAG